ncbi:dihydroneopterin aldolase [alpha proteobacterium U9-1i]|nr:dihydroneopterin aldolase [alpha proteobacterium U9-1i]
MNTALHIQALEIYAHHGVFEEERCLGQRFRFDVRADLVARGTHEQDDLSASVDYAIVAARIEQLATGKRFHTLEALAEAMARDLIRQFPIFSSVRITAAKSAPPLALSLEGIAVEIDLRRDELESGK